MNAHEYVRRPVGGRFSGDPLPYEDVVAAYNQWQDQEEANYLDKHSNAHCPRGEHVWRETIVRGIRECEVCGVGNDYALRRWNCRHCGPNEGEISPTVARENTLRRMLWLGQKAGEILPPKQPEKRPLMGWLMGWLWGSRAR